MYKVVLLRHGESTWNKENRFTGWHDVDLTEEGRAQAKRGGEVLKAEGFTFDLAYVSVLKRALRTLWIALDELDLLWIPIEKSWRLNERHYGELRCRRYLFDAVEAADPTPRPEGLPPEAPASRPGRPAAAPAERPQ